MYFISREVLAKFCLYFKYELRIVAEIFQNYQNLESGLLK